MDDKSDRPRDEGKKKRGYLKPILKIYGRVKDLTGGTTGSQAGDAAAMVMAPSDRRVKRNIVRVGDHPLGVGLYLFDYDAERAARWGHGRHLGVMADEVEAVMPAAVSFAADGTKQVDYGMLGIARAPA